MDELPPALIRLLETNYSSEVEEVHFAGYLGSKTVHEVWLIDDEYQVVMVVDALGTPQMFEAGAEFVSYCNSLIEAK